MKSSLLCLHSLDYFLISFHFFSTSPTGPGGSGAEEPYTEPDRDPDPGHHHLPLPGEESLVY